MRPLKWMLFLCGWCCAAAAQPQPAVPTGQWRGTAWAHTASSLQALVQQARVCLPTAVTGGGVHCSLWRDLPLDKSSVRVPVVLFLHGSSGLGLPAIGEWQRWLATLGYASMAPDSFALQDRVTYESPIDKAAYERIHALRASEIAPALAALRDQSWADAQKLVLAGTSEGAVSVARYTGSEFAARLIYAWSCEDNYFVQLARNAFPIDVPVLNVISASDPFFSSRNRWLGVSGALGHCGAALAGHSRAAVLLIPQAPHTLLNLPVVRGTTAGFLQQLF